MNDFVHRLCFACALINMNIIYTVQNLIGPWRTKACKRSPLEWVACIEIALSMIKCKGFIIFNINEIFVSYCVNTDLMLLSRSMISVRLSFIQIILKHMNTLVSQNPSAPESELIRSSARVSLAAGASLTARQPSQSSSSTVTALPPRNRPNRPPSALTVTSRGYLRSTRTTSVASLARRRRMSTRSLAAVVEPGSCVECSRANEDSGRYLLPLHCAGHDRSHTPGQVKCDWLW